MQPSDPRTRTASSNESQRLATLRDYDLLGTPPDASLDRITSLASRLMDVPMALVTLVDTDRVWFKSRVGVEATEIGRAPGLCPSAILQPDPWVIEDAREDPRSCEHPLVVGEFGMRFYAGVPLVVQDGTGLGTLCVLDRRPRVVEASEVDLLVDLAAMVVDEFELRRQGRRVLQLAREAEREAQQDRERARRQAGVARRLEELDASRATYLRAVSHDLQTPLSTIRGLADLLVERGEQLGAAGRDELVGQLADSAAHLHGLVQHLLDDERTHRHDGTVRRERIDAVELANEVAARVHLAGAPIVVPCGRLEVVVDRLLLERILDNLLTNARRHAPDATAIQVELGAGSRGGLMLTVSDDGPGIAEADRERVLEAFTRSVDAVASPGTGLGLSLVSRFAAMHGGTVTVGERPGGGASFTVDLPGARGDPLV